MLSSIPLCVKTMNQRTMSSSSTENVTTAANQDAHHTVTEEAAEDVIVNTTVCQDNESKTNPEIQVVGHIPPIDAFPVVVAADKPAEPKDMTDVKTTTGTTGPQVLKVAALEDANRIRIATQGIDLDKVGIKDARIIMSEEHKSLGYRPPPDSLAAKAQRSSSKHPHSSLGFDNAVLREAARADAERIKVDRVTNVNTLTAEEARKPQSEERKVLGYRPPPGSLSAEAQSIVDKRDREPVTKELAAEIMSEEHKRLGHRPKSGSFAATVQSLADRNEQHGTKLTIADIPSM